LEFGITVSLGLGIRRERDTAESLLGRADAAMYQAKTSGRNRLNLAPEEVV
jgi:PleD family two-component response regulator